MSTYLAVHMFTHEIKIKGKVNILNSSALFYTIQKLISLYTDVISCVFIQNRNVKHLNLDL